MEALTIEVPRRGLVVLVGVSGSGKSHFAERWFLATEVLSSDRFRAMIADDEADQSVSAAAFELLYLVARRRLEADRLAVVDATSVTAEARGRLLALARDADSTAVAIVLDVPVEVCLRNNEARAARRVDPEVIARQAEALEQSRCGIATEGFARIYVLGPDDGDRVQVLKTAI